MKNNRKWIFLRGLIRGKGHWWGFVEEFKKKFPGDEVELLDISGNGDLYYQDSFLTIEQNVRDLRFRSEFLKKHARVNLLTVSLGSMIGIKWAELFPTEIEQLVCINTSDARSPFYQRMSPQIYAAILNHVVSRSETTKEEFILRATTNLLSDTRVKEMVRCNPHAHESSKMNFLRQMAAAALFKAPAQKPVDNILYFLSAKDRLVSPACSRRICQAWELQPFIHPEAGHDLTTDDPGWFCSQLSDANGAQAVHEADR